MDDQEFCVDCNFFVSDGDGHGGNCNRFPPLITGRRAMGDPLWGWPWVENCEWCGEWKPQEKEQPNE